MSTVSDVTRQQQSIPEYSDELHAEVPEDLRVGEHGYKFRMVDGVVMPPYITPSRYELSRTIDTRPGDVCCTSFPKSGSNWLANVVLRLTHGGDVPSDKTLRESLQWVESSIQYPRSRQELDEMPSPRFFTSHMPYRMALGGDPTESPCRYVYIARNPKDVVVSYFHFEARQVWAGEYEGSWSHWLQMFVDGKLQRGDWFEHVLGWWAKRDAENVHFVKYESLARDFDNELRRLGSFLGVETPDELVRTIRTRTSFDKMRDDRFSSLHELKGLGHFYRKGAVGSWKERFTVHESDWFDSVYESRMRGSGLDFEFE